jgi:hypothetical protein
MAQLMDRGPLAPRDGEWKAIGLPAPAQRALMAANLTTVTDLRRCSEARIMALHGMGPNAMTRLKKAMAEAGVEFRTD